MLNMYSLLSYPILSYIRGEVEARAPNLSAEAYWQIVRNPQGKAKDEWCVRVCVLQCVVFMYV